MSSPLETESPLYHLIYSSHATTRLSQDGLRELLTVCHRNNAPRGLTGMLIYRNGIYLQLLEGPREEVRGLVARIEADPRHTTFRVLREGNLPGRLFPEWSMAYKSLSGLKSSQLPGYSESLQTSSSHDGDAEDDPAQMLVAMINQMAAA